MKRVYVIGTVHAECGLVTAPALLAILERLQPEVIFLEAPVGTLEPYLTRRDRTLESETVGRYRQTHRVTLVPVDLPTPPPSFFQDGAELFGRVERRSVEYCRLHDEDMSRTKERGLPYLNSDTYAEAQTIRHGVIVATLDDLADQRLKDVYRLWCDTIHHRELEMVRNVEAYFAHDSVRRGVLLVGASHRRPLLDKALSIGKDPPSPVIWEVGGAIDSP